MSEISKAAAMLFYGLLANDPQFPYAKKLRPGKRHMRDVALLANEVYSLDDKTDIFEMGNDTAEVTNPYWHILEDAQNIHYGHRYARRVQKNKDGTTSIRKYGKVRSWGTAKSRGSQQNISDKSKRDYGKWEYNKNGKLSQEYRSGGTKQKPSVTSTSYENVHYQYIEKIIEKNLQTIANTLGCEVARYSLDMFDEEQEANSGLMLPMIGKVTI